MATLSLPAEDFKDADEEPMPKDNLTLLSSLSFQNLFAARAKQTAPSPRPKQTSYFTQRISINPADFEDASVKPRDMRQSGELVLTDHGTGLILTLQGHRQNYVRCTGNRA